MKVLSFACLLVSLASGSVIDRNRAMFHGEKVRETSARVLAWTPADDVNPEELGHYFQGDIVLAPGQSPKNGLIDERYRWPNGVVPYEFGVNNFDDEVRAKVQRGLDEYGELTNGCVRFVERTDEDDYVTITSLPQGCYSYVGRIGGSQTINYQNPGCTERYGTIQHEMLHALGFFHEQSRTDRDIYVTINYENIQPGTESNFDSYPDTMITPFGQPYDYGSAMHYSRTAFSVNGEETITPTDPDAEIGQREHLSDIDVAKLLSMYNC